jgi:alanyl-tRNA synthetase
VTQKGSLVAPDRLRFDFTHTKALSLDELKAIETMVNDQIVCNTHVETHLMSQEEALEKGAMALFGEKYGDEVRVLSMGQTIGHENDTVFSVELCGGTHVHQTGDIGMCKIISETGISSGVRRLEAITGSAVLEYLQSLEQTVGTIAETLKSAPSDLLQKIDVLVGDKKSLERQVADLKKQVALSGGAKSNASDSPVKQIAGVKFIHQDLSDMDAKELKSIADTLKAQIGSGIVVITATQEGKVSLVVGVTDDLTSRLSAVDMVRVAAPILGGKGGGGRPDMAQAGGTDPTQISKAIQAIEASLEG